jgi:tetratricopeptide (TPR) repeat protein
MTNDDGLWSLLKKQQERIALLASFVTLGATAAGSLLDKAHPPQMPLAVFSLLVGGICVWITRAAAQSETTSAGAPSKHRYTARQITAAWVSSILVVLLAWGITYRERIVYALVNPLLSGKRVLVSDSIAWHILTYKTPAGDVSNTIAGELASALADVPYRVVVMNHGTLSNYNLGPDSQDEFILEGLSEGDGITFKAHVAMTVPKAVRLMSQFKQEISGRVPAFTERPNPLLMIPNTRFVRNQFAWIEEDRLIRPGLDIQIPLTSDSSTTAVIRLTMRYMLAASMYYEPNPRKAERYFRDVVDSSKLLRPNDNSAVARMLSATSYFLARAKRDSRGALEALRIARSFSPSDRELAVMEAYLLLVSGQSGPAQEILNGLAPTDDQSQLDELKGEAFLIRNQYRPAIEAYDRALAAEKDSTAEYFLNVETALAYAMSDIDDRLRSEQIITHLEPTLELDKNPWVYTLLGYARAINGDAAQSKNALDQAHSLLQLEEAPNWTFYAEWLGKSLLILGRSPEAIEEMTKLVGKPAEVQSPSFLLVFARNLAQVAGKEAAAEQYTDRALQINPDDAEACELKGRLVAWRIAIEYKNLDAKKQEALNEEARNYLLKAIRLGRENAATRRWLGALYQISGDGVNLREQLRRECNLDQKAPECAGFRGR